jgi:alpha-tubulin suppressor-like RCC1 family protein
MFTKKSLWVFAISLFIITGSSLAVTCGRLEKVSAGEDHSLALTDDRSLWACGGHIGYYQLGLGGDAHDVNTLTQVLGENGIGHLLNIVAFDAGWYHSLAANSAGICFSWGTNNFGQLGNNPPSGHWDVPHIVNGYGVLSEDTNVVYVSAGRSGYHSLIVDSNGYVYAFGLNEDGQCGDGTKVQKNVPVLVLDDTNTPGVYLGDITHIIAVDAGVDHSLALSDSNSGGYVWEWGANNGYSYPQKVSGLHNIVGISTCWHSVAVDSSGYVYEWKDDIPYRVPGGQMRTTYLQNIAEVSAGYNYEDYSLARTNDGRVLIWSYGGEPQYVPAGDMNTPSGLLEGIVSIGAGYYDHKLAVSEDGYGWAWGTDNSYGKFGVGDNNPHPEPTQMVCDEPSKPVIFFKTDDVNEADCVEPFIHNHINYQIFYDMNGYSDSNIFIIDILPEEVNYSSSSHDGNYVPEIHTVIWGPWNLDGSDTNTLTLNVEVTERAVPGSIITNLVKMFGDSVYERDTEEAEICCYLGNKIYVDANAADGGDGASWQTAFNDLQYALDFVTINQCYDTVYVAKGTYKTTEDANLTDADFALRDNIALFGHFNGQTSPADRDLSNPAYETILKDEIKNSYAADNVVTADGITGAVLDGFTVTGAYEDYDCGINIDNDANISIANCKIRNNYYGLGIYNNSYADIHNCTFFSNEDNHIRLYDNNNSRCDISCCTFDGDDTTVTGISSQQNSNSKVCKLLSLYSLIS